MKFSRSLVLGIAILALPAMTLANDEPAATNPAHPQPPPPMQIAAPAGAGWPVVGGQGDGKVVVLAPQLQDDAASPNQNPAMPNLPRINPGMMRIGEPPQMIKAAYVGIEVTPAGAALDSQLQLPKDTGLLVNYLDPQGPAKAAGIQINDVLTKFNDQLLIDARQLAVLVRSAKPGEEVKFSVIHEGQEQVISVKPVQKQVYDLDSGMNAAWQMMPQQIMVSPEQGPRFGMSGSGGPGERDLMVNHDGRTAHLHTDASGLTMTVTENGKTTEYKAASVADLKEKNPEAYKLYMEFFSRVPAVPQGGAGTYYVLMQSREADFVLPRDVVSQESSFSDGVTLKLSHEADGKGLHLRATGKDDKVLFDGPVKMDEQRQAVPAELRGKLDSLLHSQSMPMSVPFGPTTGPTTSEVPIIIDIK